NQPVDCGFPVTVNFDTGATGDTATAGQDYTAVHTTVTFQPGDKVAWVNVPVLGDTLDEDNEHFSVNLSSPVVQDSSSTPASLGTGSTIGNILDDDPLPKVTVSDATVYEGDVGTTPAEFTLTLSPVSGRQVTVNYSTSDGTAQSTSDYAATSGTIT